MNIVYMVIITWNIFVFLMYGADKHFAKKGKWRTKEKTLIMSAFLLGGIGAFVGMRVFKHKTLKTKFRILVPVAVILNILFVAFLIFY